MKVKAESVKFLQIYGALSLRLLAPYLAVLIFWTAFGSAWLALLAYHVQIVFWLSRARPSSEALRIRRPPPLAFATLAAGPLLYFLLPAIARSDLNSWLTAHRISHLSLAVLLLYFGLVHPILEQLHWSPLRERTRMAHLFFAGYHAIVLYALLPPIWLAICVAALTAASLAWRHLERRTGGLFAPIASHALADFGVICAALLLT